MPYKTISELPDSIKNSLPKEGQEEFLKIINSTLDQYDNENQAFQVAWGIMKKNGWKKVGDKWEKQKNFKEFYEVEKEIFATGVWNGDRYTEEDIEEMIKAFNELKKKRDIPLKLGHTDKQRILQKEGLAAAGWIKELKKKGNKLVAKIVNIPKKIKELIEKKLYKNVSAEIWWNYKDRNTGKVYPRVLTGVALLGADIPAVGGLGEFGNFYNIDWSEEDDVRIYEYQEEFNCECVECGYKMKSDKHCVELKCPECGGQMRRVERPGTGKEVNMAVWDTKYINDLPDSSFAYIKSGGEKDEEGKTKPRSLRYLPYKDKNGKIDLPHLRNALARLPQTNLSPAEKAKARAVLVKTAKQVGVGNYDEELEKLIKKEEKTMEMEKRVMELENENKELKEKVENLENEKKNLSEEKEKIEKEIKKIQDEKRETEIKAFIEKAKEEGKVVPANEKEVEALMRSALDEKKVKFTEDGKEVELSQREILERFISKLPKLADFKEYSENKEKGSKFKETDLPGTEKSKKLDVLVKEYMEKNKDADYKTALLAVSQEHPELVETEEK